MFEPFFTTKKDGTGLGLAISNTIITNHNGYILLDSEFGNGATFDIILPATVENIPELEMISITPRKFTGRVLVLDDELNIQLVLKSMLMKLGFDPVISSTGQETIQTYETAIKNSYKFDFIILDLTIPGGLGGVDTLKQIQQMDPSVKAIVSSGYTDDPILENYQTYGFCAALPKPYTMEQLIQVINLTKNLDK
jgi:CheY-like chemotaxis protein